MRITVTLDDAVCELVSVYAAAREITLGSAIGELIRRAVGSPASSGGSVRLKTAPNGLRVMPVRGTKITPEMVKEAQEDEIG